MDEPVAMEIVLSKSDIRPSLSKADTHIEGDTGDNQLLENVKSKLNSKSFTVSRRVSVSQCRRRGLNRAGSIQKRTWNRLGSKSEPLTESNLTTMLDTGYRSTKVISGLFQATVEFWSLIINQEPWLSRIGRRNSPNSGPSGISGPDSMTGGLGCVEPNEGITENRVIADQAELTAERHNSHSRNEKDCENWLQCQLSEERDRFCLWKSSFMDSDLDELLGCESDLYSDLGVSLLKTLLQIADLLLTSIRTTGSAHAVESDEPTRELEDCAQKLDQLVKAGLNIAKDGQADQIEDFQNQRASIGLADEENQFIEQLHNYISRLQRFSFQIGLALSEIDTERMLFSPRSP